jgi:hypothetical protein
MMPIRRSTLVSVGRWLAVLIPLAEIVLVVTGFLDVRTALLVGVVLEVLLAVVVVGEVAVFRRDYRRARADGQPRAAAAGAGFRAAWPPAVIALAIAEIGLWRALWWAVRRRRDVGPGELPIPYADRFSVVTWAICCLGALELAVVHVLTARWPVARWALFAVGVYALLWMLAFDFSLRQRPHLLRDGTLVLRFGHFRTTTVPLADLISVTGSVVAGHEGTVVLDGDRLALPVMSDTNIELRFDPPATVEVKGRTRALSGISFYADEPRTVVPMLRSRVLTPGR